MTFEIVAVVAAVLIAVYVAWIATRLSRLHMRVAAADQALNAARRARADAAATLVVQIYEPNDHLRAVIQQSIAAAYHARNSQRARADNDLTRTLRTMYADQEIAIENWEPVATAHRRLILARQVYNDAVRDTVALRGGRIARGLRLAAHYPRPNYFDINVELED